RVRVWWHRGVLSARDRPAGDPTDCRQPRSKGRQDQRPLSLSHWSSSLDSIERKPCGFPQGFLPPSYERPLLLGRELDHLPALAEVVGASGAAVEEALGLVDGDEAKPEVELVAVARDALRHRGSGGRVQPPQV